MTQHPASLSAIRQLNQTAAFNRWLGLEVVAANQTGAEIRLLWRPELGQYTGFLHASLIGGLIDTACGFAAVAHTGLVMASQFSVNCLSPAVGTAFTAKGRIVKSGRRQIFASGELFAESEKGQKLVATGTVLLIPVEAPAPGV